MKKKVFFLSFVCLLIGLSSVEASYLLIEDENDIERVSNNVISFYTTNYKQLLEMEALKFNKSNCLENIKSIIESPDELTREYLHDKNKFRKHFNYTKNYVKEKSDLVIKNIGEEKSQYFINGLFYIHNVLKVI